MSLNKIQKTKVGIYNKIVVNEAILIVILLDRKKNPSQTQTEAGTRSLKIGKSGPG